MPQETRFERRIDRWIRQAGTPRGAAIVIATVTSSITVAAGLLMTVFDRDSFPTIGDGLWWAVQTVTTVGYGDHVPESFTGRVVAGLVMLLGIGFVTVITASITSSFVARFRQTQEASPDGQSSQDQLREINERLERIEAALRDRT